MPARELDEAGNQSPVPRLLRGRPFDQLRQLRQRTASCSPAHERFDREHNLLPKTKPKIHRERNSAQSATR
jgi:hypothetical protein